MWGRNIKWCVGIILAVALTIAVTMTLDWPLYFHTLFIT